MTTLLRVDNATMQFGGLTALTSFSLDVKAGDLQGLIGPNGAGKTTAFNVMTGVYQPTSGAIVVDGERVNGRLPHQVNRAGLARTFQNIRLFKDLSALDNIKVACLADDRPASSPFSRVRIDALRKSGNLVGARTLDAWGNYLDWWRALLTTSGFRADEERITERATALLDVMGLLHRKDELARNLPYGEQRRLEISRALATAPKVLLLDEPAAGMNTREKSELMVLIRKIRELSGLQTFREADRPAARCFPSLHLTSNRPTFIWRREQNCWHTDETSSPRPPSTQCNRLF